MASRELSRSTEKATRDPIARAATILGVALTALALVGCQEWGRSNRATGYAEALGFKAVDTRLTTGAADIDRAACGEGEYLIVFVADNGAGLICSGKRGSWFVARSDMAVRARP